MILSYISSNEAQKQVDVNLLDVTTISWRYGYNSHREKNYLYLVYISELGCRTTLYLPFFRVLNKPQLFHYFETNFKDKCLEK
jgi:hypothetical protein